MSDIFKQKNITSNTQNTLSETLSMGKVQLTVKDISLVTNFYNQIIGLETIEKKDTTVGMGFENQQLVTLVSTPFLPTHTSNSAGLYHLAILFHSREHLAATVKNILSRSPESFVGSADHIVSEAFYFTDPEQNGIELYFDRPHTEWQWKNGQVVMGSSYIDPLQYIETFSKAPDSKTKQIGHVHLQVGNIRKALDFYQDIVGMHLTAQFPGAAFLSDGKYHHHLGLNTWNSDGAPPKVPSTGLDSFEIIVATIQDLERLKQRVEESSTQYTYNDEKMLVIDPWNNIMVVSYQR